MSLFNQNSIDFFKKNIDKKYLLKNIGLSLFLVLFLNCSSGGNKKQSEIDFVLNKKNILLDIPNSQNNQSCNIIDTLGYYYFSHGLFKEALETYQQKLDTALNCGDVYNQWIAYSEIGATYYHQGSYYNQLPYNYALEFYNKALSIVDTINTKDFISNLRDVALVYSAKGDLINQEMYLKRALSALYQSSDKNIHNEDVVFQLYIDFCDYYLNNLNDFVKAKEYLNKAKNVVLQKPNVDNEIVYLTREGDILNYEGNKKEYLNKYLEALNLSIKYNNKRYQKAIYRELVSYYNKSYIQTKNIQDLEKKDHYSNLLSIISEELSNEQVNNTMAALNVKFEVQELQIKNEKQQTEIKLQKQKTKTARILGAGALLLALGATGAGIILRRKNIIIAEQKSELEQSNEEIRAINDELKVKNQTIVEQKTVVEQKNEELEEKNNEITQKQVELETAYEELQATNEEIEAQKQQIQKAHTQITSSINYASRIQNHFLYNNIDVKEQFGDTAIIFYRPKDIVSGDFYFSADLPRKNTEDTTSPTKKMLMVADCTGHGVPGSLLTMLGQAKVKQFLECAHKPSDIINSLDYFFIKENTKEQSKNSASSEKMHDSIDIECIFYDPGTRELEYSSSSRPIIIFREGKMEKLISTSRGDVGSLNKKSNFAYETHKYQLKSGDEVFLFSDGMVDQFVAATDKKLGSKGFYELLKKIISLPVEERELFISQQYEEMIGTNENQTDDILLVGFRVS